MSTTRIIAHDPEFINLEQTYDVFIFDKQIFTTVTSVCENASEWISIIQSEQKANPFRLIIGLEVKLYTPNSSSSRHIALLALHVYRSCLIFELTYATSLPILLRRFLSDGNNTFVGVGIESNLEQLQREYGLGGGARYADLGSAAAEGYNRPDLNTAGLSELRTFLYGRDVQRPPVADNWDEHELSNEHVHHACIDAYVAYELGTYLVYPIVKERIIRN